MVVQPTLMYRNLTWSRRISDDGPFGLGGCEEVDELRPAGVKVVGAGAELHVSQACRSKRVLVRHDGSACDFPSSAALVTMDERVV